MSHHQVVKGALALLISAPSLVFAQGSYVNFESPQTSPLRMSADGTRLLAANTADNRLSVFDLTSPSSPVLIAEIQVGLEPISVNPRTNDEVWVVNNVSDSVSIVSISLGVVTDTINVKDEPMDVVFAGFPQRAYVSVARSNVVRVYDVTTHAQVASIALQGYNPRNLAVSNDGSKVYVSFALSGNRTTLVPANLAPLQPPPTNGALPPPPRSALIVDATNPTWAPSVVDYTVLDHDVAEIATSTNTVTRYFDRAGTILLGLAVSPTNGDVWVANTDARNLVRFEPNLRGHNVDNRVTRITTGVTPTITAFDLNVGLDYATLPNPAALATSLAQPTALAFDPAGTFFYAALFGSDRVAKIDTSGGILARVQIGPNAGATVNSALMRGPRGLALNAGAQRLYVQNRISNTLSIVDTTSLAEIVEIAIGGFDPTPTAIRDGRGFLYDAKLSGNGTGSCAACHIDGDTDMLDWDLGNPGGNMANVTDPFSGAVFAMHPMKGAKLTQHLRGLSTFAPFHWRGDMATLNDFNPAFDSLMGGPQLAAVDMQHFVDFVNTILYAPNPNLNLDRTLPATFNGFNPQTGLTQYQAVPGPGGAPQSCSSCHGTPTSFTPRIVQNPGANGIVGKPPPMRDFYQRFFFNTGTGAQSIQGFGFAHDGQNDEHQLAFLGNVNAFFNCWDTGMAPAVGFQRTVLNTNAINAALLADVNTLISQAGLGNCNLIGRGRIDGVGMGLLYDVALAVFITDTSGVGPFTWSALQAKALSGSIFTITGVPFGSGRRIGLDRDLDGVFDGDEANSAGTPFCFGDGSGTACPCGNASAAGERVGCKSSLGVGGRLVGLGQASIASDTLVLYGSFLPNSFALYFQGSAQQNSGNGVVFGDGLRCAGGSVLRLGAKNGLGNSSRFPEGSDPAISVKGGVSSPGTFYYQLWYRNAAAFCTSSTFNLTNGWRVDWSL